VEDLQELAAEELDAPTVVMDTRGVVGGQERGVGGLAREVATAYQRPVVLVCCRLVLVRERPARAMWCRRPLISVRRVNADVERERRPARAAATDGRGFPT
jgi:hypothetical protein